MPDHEFVAQTAEAVDKSLKFVFNVDAHITLVRARGKGKKLWAYSVQKRRR